MPPLLEACHLVKRFPGATDAAVDDVNLRAEAGEIGVLVGPSGCGKTTTLRLIAGFEHPDAGSVRCDGKLLDGPGVHLPPEQRGIGIVFQDYALFPHLDVMGNVAFGLRHGSRREREQRAFDALQQVGLGDVARRRPHDLSGGQQQRVALARALAPAPRVLLMDEPYSNLDTGLRQQLRGQLRQLVQTRGLAIVLVTHDQEEALSLADWLAVMDQGRILQTGSPREVYTTAASRFVAQFLGGTNLLEVTATGTMAESALGTLPLTSTASGRCWVSIRPEALRLKISTGHAGEAVGQVLDSTYLGSHQLLEVQVGDTRILVRQETEQVWTPGELVAIAVRGACTVLPD